MDIRTLATTDRPRFQDRQFSSQAELHDAIARAWIGADGAPTLEKTVAVLADFESEASVLEGASGWNLADENEGLEGYDRELLRDATEGLREVLLREADETLIYYYENALLGADRYLILDIDEALRRIGEETHLTFTRAVRRDDDDEMYIDWTVKPGQGIGVWHEICDDSELIAYNVVKAWKQTWDEDDGLAISKNGVDRKDGGFGEVMTIGEKKRAAKR